MASILATGEIQYDDGRILFKDSVITGQDYIELSQLLPKLVKVIGRAGLVGFPFGAGGGFGGPGGGGGGAPGHDGAPGPQGLTGIQGVTGPSMGPQGATGLQGTTGVQGVAGATGIQGVTGLQGATGVRGATGLQGPQGGTGIQGSSGQAIQNAILSARKSGSNIDFLSIGAGLSVTLLATATPFVYDINGNRITIAADAAVTITDNANNFIWADDVGATGVTTLPCKYSYVAPAGVTGQHWFDLGDNQMKVWNGAAFVAVNRLFIGYVRADGGTANVRYACEPNLVTPSDRFNRYGDGSDGFLEVTAGTTTIDGFFQYTAVVIRGTGSVTHSASGGTASELEIKAQGCFIVLGTVGLDLNGVGLIGAGNGAAGAGGGLGGAGGGGGGGSAGTGGAGGSHIGGQSIRMFGGGTAGALNTNGGNGSGNGLSPRGFGVPVLLGVGNGGGAGGDGTGGGGASGAGGGAAMVEAASIAIGVGGTMRANGASGDAAVNANSGGGAGGGGGTILAYSRVFQNDGGLEALGKTGGAGNGTGGTGGTGADGLALHIYN